ncbi:Monoacylglycerol lipase ABHD12, partial [Lachnellula suecica]
MLRLLARTPRRQQCLIHTLRPRLCPRAHNPLIRPHQHRTFLTHIPTVLLPPLVFSGLLLALWTWKCLMMVVFQNKIIYMPGLPPNARREKIDDYRRQCGGVEWREEKIRSLDGTLISLCVASVDGGEVDEGLRRVYVLYFQCQCKTLQFLPLLTNLLFHISVRLLTSVGNASSIPPRLPFLSPVLNSLRTIPSPTNIRYTLVCLSYRGYWTSHGRASETGIAKDAIAALQWIAQDSRCTQTDGVPVVIWGQSIGAGVATSLAATQPPSGLAIKTLILETPFLSVKAMLKTLYPQKWLPYRYLWPFLWNHLDSSKALGLMKERHGEKTPRVLILEAGNDELVPKVHGKMLEGRCR